MDINHIAIICDGNRRYARRQGKIPTEGHKDGVESMKKLLLAAKDASEYDKKKYGFKELSLYVLSMQNLQRNPIEVKFLMDLFEQGFTEILNSKEIEEGQIRVDFLGRTHLLPDRVKNIIEKIKEKTKDYKNFKLNFCITYGGREEIIDGINKLIAEGRTEPISEPEFGKYLYTDSEPEIVIRTSGEYRTSNFLMWQSSYSEWFFLEKTWPEFTSEDLKQVIDEFRTKRKRRFGK